jgi:hypothetical protein
MEVFDTQLDESELDAETDSPNEYVSKKNLPPKDHKNPGRDQLQMLPLITITYISRKSMIWQLNISFNAQVVRLHANHGCQCPQIESKSKWSPKNTSMLGKNTK